MALYKPRIEIPSTGSRQPAAVRYSGHSKGKVAADGEEPR